MLEELFKTVENKMKTAIDALHKDFASIRTGRASTSILDHIKVEYYGTLTPLNQIASLGVPDSRLLTIQPWDNSALGAIEKAILKADLGITPSNDGKIIRSGGKELALELEEKGYDWLKEAETVGA